MHNIKFTWFEVLTFFLVGVFNLYIAAHILAAQ